MGTKRSRWQVDEILNMGITIEFYKIYYINNNTGSQTLFNAINSLVGKSHIYDSKDYVRDLHHLQTLPNGRVAGVFRKLRPDNGIKCGEAGTDGRSLGLAANEGLFETNHFIYFSKYDIIGYVRNKNANHYAQFRDCLSSLIEKRIGMVQLLDHSSISALLRDKNVYELSCAIPISPLFAYSDSNLWSSKTIKALSESGCNNIDFTIKVDRRKKNGWLSDALENVSNIMGYGATKLKAKVETLEGEELSIIDFITTKILYIDENFSYTTGEFEHTDIYEKITRAYLEKLDEIETVQGAYNMVTNW